MKKTVIRLVFTLVFIICAYAALFISWDSVEYVQNYSGQNGEIYTGELKNGLYEGEGTIIYPDGSIANATFSDGKFTGTVIFTDALGNVLTFHLDEDGRIIT
jgi:hypothetical protein